MDNFAKLRAAERQPYFEETASRRNSTTTAIVKDFWVCWILKHLFSLEAIPELRFKGGTSLSKVFRLIDRFSEDIDISIARATLGFSGERDPANPRLSSRWPAIHAYPLADALNRKNICAIQADGPGYPTLLYKTLTNAKSSSVAICSQLAVHLELSVEQMVFEQLPQYSLSDADSTH